jgi:3-hydroxybutyryl-CoA dehydrogenase
MRLETIGIIGLGLLGRGIAATLVANGFRTIAYDQSPDAREVAHRHVRDALSEIVKHGWITPQQAEKNLSGLRIVDHIDALSTCDFVIESIDEEFARKAALFDELESLVSDETVIGTNTSALPITLIQQGRTRPGRFVGMHWGEPCHISRFQEVIRGEHTTDAAFAAAVELSIACGKEPALVQKDVRGFISNRLMYAMLRESLHLLESGVADVETIDRAFRNDIGFWATIAGPFRWMDLTGISAYASVMKDLFPELANTTELPETMQRMLDSNAEGVSNQKGFYEYDAESAREWLKRWTQFTWQIRELADRYVPVDDRTSNPKTEEVLY